jgi:hypothetical protein
VHSDFQNALYNTSQEAKRTPKQAVARTDRKTVPSIAKNTLNSVDVCAKENGGHFQDLL